MLSFQEWVIQEAATADMRTDIGRGYKFNIGDWLYFGIHELAKEVKNRKSLPLWQPQDLIHAMRPVVDIDPAGAPDGGELVWVKSDKTPNQLGYRKIAGKNGARIKTLKDGFLIGIPAEWIEDVTEVFGTGGQLSGHKLGLPYDRGIPSQTKLINLIRRVRSQKEQGFANQQQGAITNKEVDAARAALGVGGMETTPLSSGPTDFDKLFGGGGEDKPSEPRPAPLAQFRADSRNTGQSQGLDALLGNQPEPKQPITGLAGFRRQRQQQKPRQDLDSLLGGSDPRIIPMNRRLTASYDPSINPYWNNNSDTRRYQYFAG